MKIRLAIDGIRLGFPLRSQGSLRSIVILTAGLVACGVQAADRGPVKYAEGAYDAASGVYTVVKGDDLDAIAKRFGVAVGALKSENKLASNQIEIGQQLTVPGGTTETTGESKVEVIGVLGSPSATTTIPGNQLPPPTPKFGGVIKDGALQSTPWWAPRVVPPKGAPNILLIMTDDAGFAINSVFGGVIPTPAMERIAQSGLRYNRIMSTSLC